MSPNSHKRCLVVGLGISGLATAISLRRIGWEPVIAERAPGRRSGGYFVALFGAGQAAARRLGFDHAIPDRSVRDGRTYVVDRAGHRRPGLGFGDLPGEHRMVLRGDVEAAAFDALPGDVEIRFATRPTKIEQDESGVDVTLDRNGAITTERFDLVVGADGLRSTVRQLVFGPHERHLHRLGYMIAALPLPNPLDGVPARDGVSLFEPGRAMWLFPFADRPQSLLFSYRTDDVDGQFTGRPADRVRAAFGPEPAGPLLGPALDVLDNTDSFLFDTVEQSRMDSWSRGRVVLVGDSAWCVSLYAGMGASAALAGADLLGTMLQRHPGHIPGALTSWEAQLRPHLTGYQQTGVSGRFFFTPDNRRQIALRSIIARGVRLPVIGDALRFLRANSRTSRERDLDIARSSTAVA
ncbi:FAD-dependent monooxygenase [Saccharothrix algeriensis]|uniref:2-polyprenyl-6-methoxyphenol hydroxylase-like FAD-dependent oxidoreductase n=1 Tax=Saccharothrix algeriensis TaxID=173560 RepID=A0A8T8HVW8_9PSEU|nr:FAD-dependent monooxygenase [Saccharothrix algeriensis]MBM7814428.1 2-polyprenyl-6-methoxyphenol hydroxylase-like FAD-dependent oxidoreductase [Saccharothrix algeriensis]QTR02733.1 FAD-dependent monooxygenase [Saccharothrix algeriensis]